MMRIYWASQDIQRFLYIAVAAIVAGVGLLATPTAYAQTGCSTTTSPATTYGQVKQSVTVASSGTYRVWSRIKASSASNNSYFFQVGANTCATVVGDSTAIPAGAWTWVGYKNANQSSFFDVPLSAGTHQLIYTGREADVQLDRVLLLADLTCVPEDLGNECANADTVDPTVSVTSPANGSSVTKGSTVNVSATASDNVGITKVEFYVDGTLIGSDTTSPYTGSWNTSAATTASHSLTARAYDTSNNTGSSVPVSVTVTTTDTPPTVVLTAPTNGTIVTVRSAVNIAAQASDNAAVTKVEFYVDNVLKGTDTSAPYNYSWATNGVSTGPHTLTAKAYDAGNKVGTSAVVTVNISSGSITPGTNGDSNGDGRVNALDYAILLAHDGNNFPAADFDKDGTIGAGDLAILLSRWTW